MRIGTFLAALAALTGCSGEETTRPLVDNYRDGVKLQGTLQLPTTVWADNPRTRLNENDRHQYRVSIAGPSQVRFRMRAAVCNELTPAAFLFDESGSSLAIGWGGDASCKEGANIEVALEQGTYFLVLTAEGNPGRYQLDAWCDGACTPSDETFLASRIEQDELTPEDTSVFDAVGAFLFNHVYRVGDGLGNGFGEGQRPNLRKVHGGARGGPDSQSCLSCHNVGGPHGGGALEDNMFQAGDGMNESEALKRSAPPVNGPGIRQAIAKELSAALQAQATAGVARSLCVQSLDGDDVCFGDVDASGLVTPEGTDADLSIEPFGWKGREATLRGFATGGFRVHFGLQTEAPINTFCNATDQEFRDGLAKFTATWGDPAPNCFDPDHDGFEREITDGQLSAMAVYLQLLPPPRPSEGHEEAREIFRQADCHTCHTRAFALTDSVFFDEGTGANIELPAGAGADGKLYEVWSDYKRHDMGPERADIKAFPHGGAKVPGNDFITPPLWDLASAGPYMHDGESPTIEDAILSHWGTGRDSANKYSDLSAGEKELLLAFLSSLGAPTAN